MVQEEEFDPEKLRSLMGSRAAHGKPEIERAKAKSKQKEKEQLSLQNNQEQRNNRNLIINNNNNESVLDTQVDITYKPTTSESISSFELIMKLIEKKFGAQNSSIMHSFAHEIISIIKNDKFTASQTKLNELNSTFASISSKFDKNDLDYLQKCCRKINDFGIQSMDPDEKAARENNRGTLKYPCTQFNDYYNNNDKHNHNNMYDIVVPIKTFEEEDDGAYYADMNNEDDDSSADDRIEPNMEDPSTKQREEERKKQQNQTLTSRMIPKDRLLQNESNDMINNNGNEDNDIDNDENLNNNEEDKATSKDMNLSRTKKEVDPKDIDAHWLQRVIKENYPDKQDNAKETADKLLNILEINDSRQLENAVTDVLGFTNWEFTKKMLRNKDIIVWCTKLKRAQNDSERKKIEKVMNSDSNLCKILEDLQATYGTTQKKIKKFIEDTYEEAVQIRKNQQVQQEMERKRNDHDTNNEKENKRNNKSSMISNDLKDFNMKYNKMKIDLESLSFREGGHFMSSTEWKLRKGSKYYNKKGYQEIFVPHIVNPPKQHKEIPITDLPNWAQKAFMKSGDEDDEDDVDDDEDDDDEDMVDESNNNKSKKYAVTHLNAIQSQCYKTAFLTSENILLSAPTGAGKTNVAMLCILRELGIHLNNDNETVRKDEFKIVYIAPMKSLVREVVLKFSKRLYHYGINVAELSGDQQLSRQQIADTTIIVTTPEKWDIITRKGMDRSYASLVKLIIIDEIHLLHDLRGTVLESIIARTIRNIEKTENLIRLIGLSATMPNYRDIADFLRVKYDRGLFVFNSSYRPIPLINRFAGITLKKPFKQYELMNDLCYQYVLEQVRQEQQCIIFVHSRKETINTGKMLLEKFKLMNNLQLILPEDSADREILQQEALNEDNDINSKDLIELLPFGFGVHHAGMTREDRVLVEDLFKARVLKVLISTATLAWGVNMPAHAVIIKGTQIYNASLSKWCELNMLDILQMFGRAGRPDSGDKYGEAYLITTHRELKYYMPLLNDQLPIESQLISKLPDCLNAEIVLGTISNIKQGIEWLSYSFLNIRMKKSPKIYQLQSSDTNNNNNNNMKEIIKQRQIDLIHSSLLKLYKSGLILYDSKTGIIESTDIGRIASYYYISYKTIEEYNNNLSSSIINDIELFKIFSLSEEFKYISVRQGERSELLSLLDRVPIPIKESIDTSSCKINVLLQAYISRLSLNGFALKSDMCYIQQSGIRLIRALFEISLKRKWSYVARRCLIIYKQILHRQWNIESPLRQFGINNIDNKLTYSIINRIEKISNFSFERFQYLTSIEIGELIRMPSVGKDIYKLIHQIPKLNLKGQIQPITQSIIRIELQINIDFEWNDKYHGQSQEFWIIVEDVDCETILHYEYFILYKKLLNEQHLISFTIPIYNNPLPPQYFVRIISDKWLGSNTCLPISFRNLILPKKYKSKTQLLDLQPIPINKKQLYNFNKNIIYLNSIQTQIYNHLYHTNNNILLCGPTYCGKTTCAEIAIIKMLNEYPNGKCIYITSNQYLVDKQYNHWIKIFENKCIISKLNNISSGSHSIQNNLKLINKSQIIISTPKNYDRIQRGWRKRKSIQNINLFILDNLHFIGINNNKFNGSIYEMIISRQKYIMSALSIPTRIIALSLSISNAKDIGDWLDVNHKLQFNFSSLIRPIRINSIKIKSSDINNFESRHISFIKPCYSFIDNICNNRDGGIIIFVSNRKHCRRLASDILALSYSESNYNNKNKFLNLELNQFLKYLNKCKNISKSSGLYKCLKNGIGFIHQHTDNITKSDICKFYKSKAIKILIVESSLCFELELFGLKDKINITSSVIIFGNKYYCGLSHNYIDYELSDLNEMISFMNMNNNNNNNNGLILCHSNRESFLRKFLIQDSYPIESNLDCNNNLEDCLLSEIVNGTITTADDAIDFLTWTFYYFRLTQNPNYYNLRGISDNELSQHLSELIEESFHRLYNANCISVDENMNVSKLNNGLISSYYYITYTSIEFFYTAINKLISNKKKIKLKNILSILSFATEFDNNICLRKNEENTIKKISKHLPILIIDNNHSDISTKVNVLLQTHFMRLQLKSPDIINDRDLILKYSINLLYSIIDILSTLQILNGVLITIELCQMIIQSMWDNDNYLLQLPYINKQNAEILKNKYKINNIYDLLEIDDNQRLNALNEIGIANDKKKLNDIAIVCNQYPDLDLSFDIVSTHDDDGNVTMIVSIQKDNDDDDEDDDDDDEEQDKSKIKTDIAIVNCPRYPLKKYETWFLIVGDEESNKLIFIKRFTMKTLLQRFKVTFNAETNKKYKLYLMSDSYLGCDQYLDIDL